MLTSSGVFMNFLKTVIGSGVFALPYAILKAGVIPSLILLFIIWILSVVTTVQLCEAAAMLTSTLQIFSPYTSRQLSPIITPPRVYASPEKHRRGTPMLSPEETPLAASPLPSSEYFTILGISPSHPRFGLQGSGLKPPRAELRHLASTSHVAGEDDVVSYMQLSMATFGERAGFSVAWIGLMPAQFVIGASFLIFAIHNVAAITGYPPGVITVLSTLIASLMCIPRTMDYLAYTSTLGNIAFFVSVTCIVWSSAEHGLHMSNLVWWGSWSGFFEAFGVLCLSFSAHPEALSIMNEADAKAKKQMPWLIAAVLSVALVVFTAFSFVVLSAFGDKTQPIVFDNLPAQSWSIKLVRLLISLMLQATFPIVMFPIFHILETSQIDAYNITSRLMTRVSITLSVGAFAWFFVNYFEPIAAIVGGFIAITAYILPPLFYLELKATPSTSLERNAAIFSVTFGLLGCIVSIVSGIQTIMATYR